MQWRVDGGIFDPDAREEAVATNAVTIGGLVENTKYSVQIIALRLDGQNAAPSDQIFFTTPRAPVGQVQGVTLVADSATAISVSWTAIAGADDYKVQWRTESQTYGVNTPTITSGTSATISGLVQNTEYYIIVTGQKDQAGDGIPSERRTGNDVTSSTCFGNRPYAHCD